MIDKPLIVIVGPTASGKSALAMDIARRFDGEIVCADSRTVYRGMDIGTAKPTVRDQTEVPHHLLDVVGPDQEFNAARFKQLAEAAIIDIRGRGKLPLLVGGTGLYVNALIFDYEFGAPADTALRQELTAKSVEELQQICVQKHIDLPTNHLNKRHLVRAIEMQGLLQQQKQLIPNTFVAGITLESDILHHTIARRADEMFDSGVVKEASALARTYGWDIEPMKGNIYRVARRIVEDGLDLSEAKELFIQSDIRLAKRQMTWFRANPYIHWGAPDQLKSEIEHFLTKNNIIPAQ